MVNTGTTWRCVSIFSRSSGPNDWISRQKNWPPIVKLPLKRCSKYASSRALRSAVISKLPGMSIRYSGARPCEKNAE